MIWEGKIYQTDYDQLTVCRWPLGRYLKKKKKKNLHLMNQKYSKYFSKKTKRNIITLPNLTILIAETVV